MKIRAEIKDIGLLTVLVALLWLALPAYAIMPDPPDGANVPPAYHAPEHRLDAAIRIHEYSKLPWQMSREEWHKSGCPDLRFNWHQARPYPPVGHGAVNRNAFDEVIGLNDFIGLFADPVAAARKGRLAPGDSAEDINGNPVDWKSLHPEDRYLKDRQEDFAQSVCIQTWSNFALGVEDAREAIIIGRKLGYQEQDILFYLLRNYLPNAFEAIRKGEQIPSAIIKIVPNLALNSHNNKITNLNHQDLEAVFGVPEFPAAVSIAVINNAFGRFKSTFLDPANKK